MNSERNRKAAASRIAERRVKEPAKVFVSDTLSLLELGALKAAVEKFQRDDALGLAAQLAYYLILSLFPFMLVLVSLMGTFGSEDLAVNILGYFKQVMPSQVYDLFETYTEDVIKGRAEAPGLLSFGILFTIWTASGAFSAMMKALNRCYGVRETRPFWKAKGIAILMTLGLSALVLAGVLLLILGPAIGSSMADFFRLGGLFEFFWNIVRWPVALTLMMVSVALLYYFAPNADLRFRWITPGGLIGVLLWVLASVAFSVYVNNFGSYNKTYGTIGVIIVLLLYLYISSLTILFGATLNATLPRTKETPSGERAPGAGSAPGNPEPETNRQRESSDE